MARDWSVFDGFACPVEVRSWDGVREWGAATDSLLQPARERVAVLRARWDGLLADLGGDPSSRDWHKFRPLRLDREEDWSDWLAQLIEDSTTGRFARTLLATDNGRLPQSDYVASDVRREVPHEGYRADLIIHWATDRSYTHIEVKVGDPHLSKTLETARKMESLNRANRCRSDFILLKPDQTDAWEEECRANRAMGERVRTLSWSHVARALRDALVNAPDEPLFWRAWAYAFCGAIGQQLLDIDAGPTGPDWVRGLNLDQLTRAEALFALNGGD